MEGLKRDKTMEHRIEEGEWRRRVIKQWMGKTKRNKTMDE